MKSILKATCRCFFFNFSVDSALKDKNNQIKKGVTVFIFQIQADKITTLYAKNTQDMQVKITEKNARYSSCIRWCKERP